MASVSRKAGGLFESVRRLHQSLAELPDISVNVMAAQDEFTAADIAAWLPIKPKTFRTCGPWQFGYAPGLNKALFALEADVLHTHGIWMFPSVVARGWHRNTGRPYIISPHGMLDPWAVNNSAWKKKIASRLFERNHLGHAACIRALCESEADSIRGFGLKNPICIIPNGIDIPQIGNQKAESRNGFQISDFSVSAFTEGRKVLLYLGRIHPKKGLVNLLKAWAAVQKAENGKQKAEEWVLAIAGWDQGGHEAQLKRVATELAIPWADVREQIGKQKTENRNEFQLFSAREMATPISPGRSPSSAYRPLSPAILSPPTAHLPPPSVLFLGPLFGPDKASAYSHCDAFILPSVSEGLPMVILEAWAYGKPVLMTPECNLPEGFTANAAIRIGPNVESIVQGLAQLLRSPSSDLCSLGANGRQLVAEKFAWPQIGVDMKSVYEWVLGRGPKPACVV